MINHISLKGKSPVTATTEMKASTSLPQEAVPECSSSSNVDGGDCTSVRYHTQIENKKSARQHQKSKRHHHSPKEALPELVHYSSPS